MTSPTQSKDDDAIGDVEDVLEVVTHEEDRSTLVPQGYDEVKNLARLPHSESGSWLIEKKDAGVS